MLAIMRRIGEKLHIGDDVEIQVLDIDEAGASAELSVKAPEHIKIDRKECRDRHVFVGSVIRYDASKGYGFIRTVSLDENVFFHVSSVSGVDPDQLKQGLKVCFRIEYQKKGIVALDVVEKNEN